MDQTVPEDLVNAGRGYETLFVPALFDPWARHLLEGAGVEEGPHGLDIACGTGVLARSALSRVGRNGRVVGADPAPGMLAVAREVEPGVDWILCSAEALDVEDESFDAVMSQFGMMFFADRNQSAREMYRALKPGGHSPSQSGSRSTATRPTQTSFRSWRSMSEPQQPVRCGCLSASATLTKSRRL